MPAKPYHELTPDAGRNEVKAALTAVTQALAYSSSSRRSMVQTLINDIHTCAIGDSDCKLKREDAALALSALKSLGRNPDASAVISSSENLSLMLAIEIALRPTDVEAANEALRCVANALLLVDASRDTWIEVGGAAYCAERLKSASSPVDLFLVSRILFLSTASATSPFLETLLDGLSQPTDNIVQVIGSRLEFILDGVVDGQPLSREAMIDLLKFSFNLVCHGPKLSLNSNSSASISATRVGGIGLLDTLGLGERWDERLDGILAPLLKAFVGLPIDPKSPLAPPMSHTLHALIAVPASKSLKSVWLADKESEPPEDTKEDAEGVANHQSPSSPRPYQRALHLLETALSKYFPGNIDPDDKSVRERASKEREDLSHILCPLVLLLTKYCNLSPDCRADFRNKVIPPDLDRTTPLEQHADTLGRCIRLMAAVYYAQLKDAIGELLFAACNSDAQFLSSLIGYGNVAGFLFNKGIMAPPPKSEDDTPQVDLEFGSQTENINPITGMVNREDSKPVVDMTDEEKEREAEKLFVLFERMEKVTGMENPIKKALHEGKLEKYSR